MTTVEMAGAVISTFTEIMEKKINSMLQEAVGLLTSNPQGAITKLTRAIALQPHNAELFRQRAEAYEALHDHHSAILNFRKALILGPPNKDALAVRMAEVYCTYGERLCEEQQHVLALEMFMKALEHQPHNREYALKRITCLSTLKRYDECIEMIKQQLEEDGTSTGLYTSRSVLHMMFGNNTQAFYDACRALELDPSNFKAGHLKDQLEAKAEAFKSNAITHALVGEKAEAIKNITSAIESNPQRVDYHIFRGSLYRKTGQYDKALDDLLIAMDINEHKVECPLYSAASRQLVLTYNDFAIECFSKQHYDEAVTLLNKAIKSEKREKGIYVNRGDCFYHMRNLPFALADYKQAFELDQSDWGIASRIAVVTYEIGLQHFHEQNLIKAKEYLSDAIKFNPSISHFYVCRAMVLQALKNIPEAERDLAHALYLEPNNENCLAVMARVCPGKIKEDILENYTVPSPPLQSAMTSSLGRSPPTDPTNKDGTSILTVLLKDESIRPFTHLQDKIIDAADLTCSNPSNHSLLHNDSQPGTQSPRDFYMQMFYCKKAVSEDFRRMMDTLVPSQVPAIKLLPLRGVV